MKYWRWKCQPCGREVTILAGTVPKPCILCACWDFLKLGETNDKNEAAEDFRKRTRSRLFDRTAGQVKLIFHDDTTFDDVVKAIESAGWRVIHATNDPDFDLSITPAKDRLDKS